MRWKIFTIIAVLLLVMTTSAPPSKVEAQGLVEYALILVLVAIATDEVLELYLPSSNVPMPPPQGSTPLMVGTLQPAGVRLGGPICRQTFQTTVPTTPGLINILNIKMNAMKDKLLINGEEVADLDPSCFSTANRVVLTLGGGPIPPSMVERLAADPNTVPAESGASFLSDIWGWTIADSNGLTVATSSTVPDVPRSFLLHILTDTTN